MNMTHSFAERVYIYIRHNYNLADNGALIKAVRTAIEEANVLPTEEAQKAYIQSKLRGVLDMPEVVWQFLLTGNAWAVYLPAEQTYIWDEEGGIKLFSSQEEAEAEAKKDRAYFRILRSVGVCKRCGSPLFKSMISGYTSQCFTCDEDFFDFEQGADSPLS